MTRNKIITVGDFEIHVNSLGIVQHIKKEYIDQSSTHKEAYRVLEICNNS